MRAPGEAPGLMALEIAMDEMAEKLGLIRSSSASCNDTQVDPENPEPTVLLTSLCRVPAHGRRTLRLERAEAQRRARSATATG